MQTQINTIEQAMLSIQQMPVNAQQQIFNYIFEMQHKQKHQAQKLDTSKEIPSDIEKSFGILKAKKSVSLEEMDNVIRRRGAGL